MRLYRSALCCVIAITLFACDSPTAARNLPVRIASVSVASATGAPLVVGDTLRLTATLRDAAGNSLTGRAILWSSSDPLLATVSAFGLVTGRAAGGPVTITATADAQHAAADFAVLASTCITRIVEIDEIVTGELMATDCRHASGAFADYWQLTLPEPREVTLDFASPDFDALLRLYDAAGVLAHFDDNGGAERNAFLTRPLSPGTWTIVAASFSRGEVGGYTLSVTAPPVDPPCAHRELPPDGIVTDTLTTTDCRTLNGNYRERWRLVLPVRSIVDIVMRSDDFDTLLQLTDAAGNVIDQNDDEPGVETTNSRIETLRAAGVYFVYATTSAPNALGVYQLSVTLTPR